MEAPDLARQHWDAIIVGTGIGGATLGFALARSGRRVLFCEKGKSPSRNAEAVRGLHAEMKFARAEVPKSRDREILANAGRYADEWEDRSAAPPRTFIPFVGSGSGGSSALYGMAMERLLPIDFTPGRCYPDAEGSTLPEKWPVSYAELDPYYRNAESLYRVRGTRDPLREASRDWLATPPPLSAPAAELRDFFAAKGLHPYRLPLACEFLPECQCCQGYLCPRQCKNDSARICVQPAVSQYGAALLDECEVVRLEASAKEVTAVICAWRGRELRLRGGIVALAAGALESPSLLLRSSSAGWPHGLANHSGLVGRNLMRHHVDLYLLSARSPITAAARHKELAFNDFYFAGGEKLGTVQSFGPLPPAPLLSASLEEDLRHGKLPLVGALFRLVKPAVTRALDKLLMRRLAFATLMEDLPYADNCITPLPLVRGRAGPRAQLDYRLRPHAAKRIDRFRAIMKEVLRPYRYTLIKQAENNQMLAHACGTCRFGEDPQTSVLDANNRAHGGANLYVVDSSFFPSSTGTNPSLTIAANALRVADQIALTGK